MIGVLQYVWGLHWTNVNQPILFAIANGIFVCTTILWH